MGQQRFQVYDPWLTDDQSRLLRALSFSALAHLILAVAWKMPPPDWQAAGRSAISVSFRAASMESRQAPLPTTASTAEAQQRPVALTQRESPAKVAAAPEKATAAGVPAATAGLPQSSAIAERAQALPRGAAAPGADTPPAPKAGWVNAMLSIGESGQVQQILWRELPALTNEQLRQLELSIRARNYGNAMAGRTVNETVDVRPFLSDFATRREETATPVNPANQ